MDIMRKDEGGKGGVIVNISSIAALLQDEFLPIYYGTKSAVLQFSNCIGVSNNISIHIQPLKGQGYQIRNNL